MIWYVSDLHFQHSNIIIWGKLHRKYASLEDMHSHMIDVWNSYIAPTDTVINLGDLCFKPAQKRDDIKSVLEKLSGKHVLIKGNHDSRDKISYFPTITEVHDSMDVNIQGVDFHLAHYSLKDHMTEHDKVGRPECFTEIQYNSDGSIRPLISGHTHEEFTVKANNLCVCWDRFGRPVSEDEIISIYNDTEKFTTNFEKYNSNAYHFEGNAFDKPITRSTK